MAQNQEADKECQLSSKDVQEILETDLSCAVCQDIYINPIILNCSHSFCKFCLYRWLSKKPGCPQCRVTTSFQAENLALRNIINKMVQKSGPQYQANRAQCITQRLKDEEALDKSGATRKLIKQASQARPTNHRPGDSGINPHDNWSHHVHLSFFSSADFASDENSGSAQAGYYQVDSDSDEEPEIENIDIDGSDYEDLDDSRDATFDIDQESIGDSDSDIQQEDDDNDDADDNDAMDGLENSSSSSSDESDSEIQYEPDNYQNQVNVEDDHDDDDEDDDDADDDVRYRAPYYEPDFDDSSISSDSDSDDLVESISSERNRGLESDDEDDCIPRPASLENNEGMSPDREAGNNESDDDNLSSSSLDSDMETDRYSDESTIEYESDEESG